MAVKKGRMIDPEIWEDDFFLELSIFERLVWVGLLTGEPDDQGRFQDNVRLIKSHLFPGDDIDLKMIQIALEKFAAAGKIVRYEKDGKNLIQIRHWWRYQTMRWAGPSKYAAPEGWIDREHYHGPGREIIERNWKSLGGFVNDCTAISTEVCTETSTVMSKAVISCQDVDDDDDVNDDENENDDVDVPATGAGDDNNAGNSWVRQDVITQFEQISKLTAPINQSKIMDQWFKALARLIDMGVTPEIMRQACEELTAKKYRIAGPWSIEKPCQMILAERKRETIPKNARKRDSEGKFAEFINH